MLTTIFFCTTISIARRIIKFTCLLIITTNAVLLILNGGGVFFGFCFFVNDTIHFFPFTWVFWFLNTLFSFDQSFWNFISFNLARDTLFAWRCSFIIAPCLDILETLGLSLLIFIYFGCYILVILSDKLVDEIELVFFSGFTVSSFSVLW